MIAKFLHPGRENMGFIITTILGIAGALVATFIGKAVGWYEPGQGAGIIGAVVGAILLLVIYGAVAKKAA